MLWFDRDTDFGPLAMRPFTRRPQGIAAMVVDQPFTVANGEAYCRKFQAGDYVCIGEDGPFGLTAEEFARRYRPLNRRLLSTFEAYIDDAGVITLEPAE